MAKRTNMTEETLLFAVLLFFAAVVVYYLTERTNLLGHNYRLIEGSGNKKKKVNR